MKKILQAISIIGVTLLAIYLVQIFNIFEYVPIVPVDIVQETGLTTYLSILELARSEIFEWIEKTISERQNTITCAFAIKGDEADITHSPIIEVRDGNSVKPIDVVIKLKGKKRKISTQKIEIGFPDWVDIQNVNRDTKAHIRGRKWYVNLSDIVESCSENVDISRIYTIALIKNVSDDGLSDSVNFSHDNKKFNSVKYVTNSMTIKNIQ